MIAIVKWIVTWVSVRPVIVTGPDSHHISCHRHQEETCHVVTWLCAAAVTGRSVMHLLHVVAVVAVIVATVHDDASAEEEVIRLCNRHVVVAVVVPGTHVQLVTVIVTLRVRLFRRRTFHDVSFRTTTRPGPCVHRSTFHSGIGRHREHRVHPQTSRMQIRADYGPPIRSVGKGNRVHGQRTNQSTRDSLTFNGP